MDIAFFIRSVIFLVAGLLIILYPEKVNKFQKWLINKFRIKYNLDKEKWAYKYLGIIFIIISVILFIYSISK